MDKLKKGTILIQLEDAMAGEMRERLEWRLRGKTPKLSIRDSKIIRLICHNISREAGHYTQAEVTEILNIPQQTVSFRVALLKEHHPELIILTPFEGKCAYRHLELGQTIAEIAYRLNVSESAVSRAFKRARDKGQRWCKGLGRKLSYDALQAHGELVDKGTDNDSNWLDDKIKEKF